MCRHASSEFHQPAGGSRCTAYGTFGIAGLDLHLASDPEGFQTEPEGTPNLQNVIQNKVSEGSWKQVPQHDQDFKAVILSAPMLGFKNERL